MELPAPTIGALVVLAILLGVVAIVLGVLALQGQRRVREAYARFSRGSSEDVLTLLARHVDEVGALRTEVAAQGRYGEMLRALIATGLSRVGTVRYDAFDDMGGRLSFSTALLDEHADGVVLTSINGRVETRTYAKPVTSGTSPHNLSKEEVEAIRRATERVGRSPVPVPVVLPVAAPTEVEVEDEDEDDEAEPPVLVGAPERVERPRPQDLAGWASDTG